MCASQFCVEGEAFESDTVDALHFFPALGVASGEKREGGERGEQKKVQVHLFEKEEGGKGEGVKEMLRKTWAASDGGARAKRRVCFLLYAPRTLLCALLEEQSAIDFSQFTGQAKHSIGLLVNSPSLLTSTKKTRHNNNVCIDC